MQLRAPRRDEAQAVLDLIVSYDVATIGRPDYTMQDVLDDWALPDLELDLDVFVVEDDDGTLIGWADVDERAARVAVLPGHEGRGVGTLLREAIERRMHERGFVVAQGIISANAAAVEHLRAAGWERVQVYQHMRADLRGAFSAAPLDAHVRRLDLAAEGPAVHALIDTAFRENALNTSGSYANWHAEVGAKSDPAFRLALDDEQGLVGAAVGELRDGEVGYIGQLAVAVRARGRGHGRALLVALLDAFASAGVVAAELSVAGANTPAKRLYESAGMVADFAAERWQLLR